MSIDSKLPPFLNPANGALAGIAEGISALAQRSSEAFKNAQAANASSASSPMADIAKNFRAAVGAQATKLDLVTQEEFQVQRALLEKSMAKLAELTAKINALEAQIAQNNSLKTP
jgi:ubiquinone biosynthesis accessory factor UbiK